MAFFRYGGRRDDKKQCYNSGSFKGTTVPTPFKYSELRSMIYNVTKVSPPKLINIIMRVKQYKLDCEYHATSINDNANVKCLIFEMDCNRCLYSLVSRK